MNMDKPNFGINEEAAFDHWLNATCPSGSVEQVMDKWLASSEYADYMDNLVSERANLQLIEQLLAVDSYVTDGQTCRYVRVDGVPKEVVAEFDKWLFGQTCPIINDDPVGRGQRGHCYVWDWVSWRDGKVRALTTPLIK